MKVGFIGLGRMGQAMSRRILGAKHDLVVYNRTRAKADELGTEGATVVSSIAEACKGRDVVITMVTTQHCRMSRSAREASASRSRRARST
jgi:3-hydroxyisobutyrate dehydrogenase-like beta-hydroxyacid dehydrogenase